MKGPEPQFWMCEYPVEKKKKTFHGYNCFLEISLSLLRFLTSMQTGQFCLDTFSTHLNEKENSVSRKNVSGTETYALYNIHLVVPT